MPTKNWTLHYAGHDIRVENYWNLLSFARERLFVDGRLADESSGFMRTSSKLEARLRGDDGEPFEVKATLSPGFLGLKVICKIWVNSELVLGDVDGGMTNPGRGPI